MLRTTLRSLRPVLVLPWLSCLLLTACSQGGEEKNGTSEVILGSSNHALAGLFGLSQFPAFPIVADRNYFDGGDFTTGQESNTYRIRRGNVQSGEDNYLLAKDGALTVLVRRQNAASLRWPGAYALDGEVFFFAAFNPDRRPYYLGLYTAVRRGARRDPVGDYHLFGTRLVFAAANAAPDADRVGQTFAGNVAVDAPGAVTGACTVQSARGILPTYGGRLDVHTDSKADLTLQFTRGASVETRVFHGGAGEQVFLGVSTENADGDVGLAALVRKFQQRPDPIRLEGTYYFGSYALFPNPANSGADSAVGTLRLTAGGGWSLSGTSANSVNYQKSGTFILGDDGGLVFTDARTRETWRGAVDTKYTALFVVDTDLTSSSELEFTVAVRAKT